MKEIIIKIINQWDPVDLFPHAPQDEYELEIKEVIKIINSGETLTSAMLGQQIYELFLRTLGSNVFLCSVDECHKIAEKILNEIGALK